LAAEAVPFWRQAQISFGNSALLLSGGAMMGIYHYGVVRALVERGALPKVISGTSAGAVVASFLAVRTDEEVRHELRSLDGLYREQGSDGPLHGSHFWKVRKLLRDGVLYSVPEFKAHLGWFSRGLTFREAFLRTGRVVSITCTPHKYIAGSSPPMSTRR
jgi:predicted acylesterase/phospholipase RssA